jgi:hypothetical protein
VAAVAAYAAKAIGTTINGAALNANSSAATHTGCGLTEAGHERKVFS